MVLWIAVVMLMLMWPLVRWQLVDKFLVRQELLDAMALWVRADRLDRMVPQAKAVWLDKVALVFPDLVFQEWLVCRLTSTLALDLLLRLHREAQAVSEKLVLVRVPVCIVIVVEMPLPVLPDIGAEHLENRDLVAA